MDLEKDSNREAFEAIPRNARLLRGAIFKDGEYVALSLFDESSKELAAQLNYGWSMWLSAKAQAVPDGFVVVPKEPTDAMLFAASGRDIVAEHYGDENILWPELRETWKAMIEAAQEQKG